MSRRRTTKKIYQASTIVDTTPMVADGGNGAGAQAAVSAKAPAADGTAGVSAEALDRLLAAEVAEREIGERRTTSLLGRYFKLTLALACLNMVVAGVNVAMLFGQPREIRTVVTVPVPAAPAPVSTPALAQPAAAPAAPVVPAAEAAPPAAASKMPLLGPAPKLTPKTPLLGKAPAARRAPRAPKAPLLDNPAELPSAEPARAVAGPDRTGQVLTAKLSDEHSAEDSSLAERW
jgi:hypothetical protein